MEGINVTLISKTENPELTVYKAARNCTTGLPISELMPNDEASRDELIRRVMARGHMSVLENASFTFGIEGVSRALSHQLVRHRVATFGQCSQRYTTFGGKEFTTPPSIALNNNAMLRYLNTLDEIRRCYEDLQDMGIPKEDARYILPNAAQTKLVMTMNARELRHFFNLRCCEKAQWEIRFLAERILELCMKTAPVLFASAGASCEEFGTCPEGANTCGRHKFRQHLLGTDTKEATQ